MLDKRVGDFAVTKFHHSCRSFHRQFTRELDSLCYALRRSYFKTRGPTAWSHCAKGVIT
jgi:hypothetical protein